MVSSAGRGVRAARRGAPTVLGSCVTAAVWLLAVGLPSPVAGQVYRWVDEEGGVHYTTDLDRVPRPLRGRISEEIEATPPRADPEVDLEAIPGPRRRAGGLQAIPGPRRRAADLQAIPGPRRRASGLQATPGPREATPAGVAGRPPGPTSRAGSPPDGEDPDLVWRIPGPRPRPPAPDPVGGEDVRSDLERDRETVERQVGSKRDSTGRLEDAELRRIAERTGERPEGSPPEE